MTRPLEGSADPLAHFEALLSRYATGVGGSLSDVPTVLDYARPVRETTGEIAPKKGVPQRGGEDHLRDLTYVLLGVLTAARQLREKLAAAEERASQAEERLTCAEQTIVAQGERVARRISQGVLGVNERHTEAEQPAALPDHECG